MNRMRIMRPVASGGEWTGLRKRQEDSHAIDAAGVKGTLSDLFCVVCDGMGGHAGGQVASRTAVNAALQAMQNPKKAKPADRLIAALTEANVAVGKRVKADADLAGMGATFLAVLVSEGRIYWISVGDSPLFMYSSKGLRRLNADHSFRTQLDEQAKRGEITREDALRHPNRNALISAVMGDKLKVYDVGDISVRPDSRLILASDGIDTLTDAEIESIVEQHLDAEPRVLQEALLKAVRIREKPKQDNTTVIAIDPKPKPVGSALTSMPLALAEHKKLIAGGAIAALLLIAGLVTLSQYDPSPSVKVRNESSVTTVVNANDPLFCKLESSDPIKPHNLNDFCACIRNHPDREPKIMFILDDETHRKAEYCVANNGALPPEDTAQEPVTVEPEQPHQTTSEQTAPAQATPPTRSNGANSGNSRANTQGTTRQTERKPIEPVEDSKPPQLKPEVPGDPETALETEEPDNPQGDGATNGSQGVKPEGEDAQAPKEADPPPEAKRIILVPETPVAGKEK